MIAGSFASSLNIALLWHALQQSTQRSKDIFLHG